MTPSLLSNDLSCTQAMRGGQCARHAAILFVVCAAAVATSGCGSKLKTYPVRGKVHFSDGQPFPGGIVIFVSRDTGIQSRARIQQDGTYELGTLSKDDGSVAGLHRVAVQPLVRGPGMGTDNPIARRFQSSSTSGLEFNVRTDGPNDFDIEVELPDERQLRRENRELPDL